ncbi:MAG: 2-keto-4-pentenoate hydratase [Pseudolabrys sp.]
MPIDLAAAIDDFWKARARKECFPRVYFDRLTVDEAYRIQLAMIDRRVASGERQIGWKVGLTAKPIQDQFGHHEPVFGCILESHPTGHVFSPNELINPGFESELCIRLGAGLQGEISADQARAAVHFVFPSLEIIETRGDLAGQLALALVDNAQQRAIVVGAPASLDLDAALDMVAVRVQLNGRDAATGFGAAVLGNPLNSILWLAGKLDQYGRRLRPGDIVMTGSFVRQFPLVPGDTAVAEFSGIGRVEAGIAKT